MYTPKAIRELRQSLGLSQHKFGRLLGVVRSTVCHWESGKKHPCYRQLVRLDRLARNVAPS